VKQLKSIKIIRKTLIHLATAIISAIVVLFIIFSAVVTGHSKLLVAEAASIFNTQNIDGNSSTDAPAISLDTQVPNVNQRFNMTNIKPGDTFYQNYDLAINNSTDASIELEMVRTSAITDIDLAEKIVIKIMTKVNENDDITLFDGTMADLVNYPIKMSIKENSNHLIYNIAVSMPEDIGNDFQGKSFVGDIKWLINGKPLATNPNTGNKDGTLIILFFYSALSIVLICLNRKKVLLFVKKTKVLLKN